MPITIGRIDNLFWSNNSYEKPNCAPTILEAQEVPQRPIIYDFMGGRTHLYGDHWNYAIYKGVYYFLRVERCLDLEKKHYSYVLIRDLWTNIIVNNNVEVNGLLTTTNRDEWIKANLNNAYPVLLNPCEVTRLSLVEEEQSLEDTEVIKSRVPLSLPLFDIRELREFKDKWVKAARKYKKQVELNKYHAGNSPIFIFAELKGRRVDNISCWKEYARIKINSFIDEIKSKKDELVISKVKASEAAGRLQEHYCITWKKGGIGGGVENVAIDSIDLSGLTDIVAINPKTMQERAAWKVISEDIFNDIEFPFWQGQEIGFTGELITRKVRRKIYFPITQNPQEAGISLAPHYLHKGYEDNELDRSRVSWHWLPPQRLKLKETGIKEIFLFWVDNADFVLNYSNRMVKEGARAGVFATDPKRDLVTSLDLSPYFADNRVPDGTPLYLYPFHATGGDHYHDWFFNHHLITPIGFLIFKPFHKTNLDGYIWKGPKSSKIQYISGIKRTSLEQIESGRVFSSGLIRFNDLPYSIWDYYNKENKELNNDNWNRYYFNVLNGLDILLQPNQKGYQYEYRTWREKDRTSNNYSPRYLQHDKAPWLDNKAPFFSQERHLESNQRSKSLINWLVMKTLIDIPVELENGDYIFNDIEYWVDKYDTGYWSDAQDSIFLPSVGGYTIIDKLFTLEDYFKLPQPIEESDNNSVVICSTREGGLEVRQCIRFSKVHKLHSDIYSENLADSRTDIDDLEGYGGSREVKLNALSIRTNDLVEREQAIETVNGATSQTVRYMVLKQMDGGKIEKDEETLKHDLLKKVIAAFLKSNGYKVSHDGEAVLYYERKDLDGPEDAFFDLVGTEWYAHFKNGLISLIAKTATPFKPKELKVSKLKESPKLREMSVLEKVNQRCVLNVYTHQRLLNTRFNFDNDKLNISVKAVKPVHKKNPTNYFYINLRGDYDVIEREILSIQKKELEESASIVDYAQLETLRAQMRANDRDYEISMARDVLYATEKENEHYRREKWNLDTAKFATWLNAGATLANLGLVGVGLNLASTVASSVKSNKALEGITDPMELSKATTKLRRTQRKAAAVGAATATNIVTKTSSAIVDAFTFAERAQRIEKDREFAFKDLAFRSMDIDLSHRDAQQAAIAAINNIGNVYSRGTINDIDMIEEFNKENNLGNINLTVFTPSKKQLELLEAYREEYGIDCEIPNATIQIRSGMSGDIIRFNYLNDECVRGLTNRVEREYMMAILQMGIKVADGCVEAERKERRDKELFACANIYQLTKEIENQQINNKEFIKLETSLRNEIADLKVQITQKDTELQTSKANLDQQVANYAILVQQKSDLDEQLKQCRATIQSHTDDIDTLNQEKEDLKEQLRQCKIDHKNVTQAKDTCDLINSRKIKELEAKIKDLEEQIKERQIEIDAQKQGLSASVSRAELLSKQYKDLEAKLTQQTNISNLYKQEADSFKAQKENLENQKADIERQLREALAAKDEITKQLEEEKKKPRPATPERPKKFPDECNLMKEVLNDPYEIDIKERDNGLSRFLDLVASISEGMKWLRRSGMDARLLAIPSIKPIIRLLEAMEEEIPIFDKMEEAITDNAWDKFAKELNNPKLYESTDPDISRIYDKMREIMNMQKMHTIHGVKSALDELNYLTHKARRELRDQLETNQDIKTFFAHVYPGKALDIYVDLFGKPENAVTRKKATNELTCTATDGESILETIQRFRKVAGKALSKASKDKEPEEVAPVTPVATEVTLSGIPLTTDKKYFIPPFNWFRNEVTASHRSVGGSTVNFANIGKKYGAFKIGNTENGIPRWGLQMYNLPYTITDSKDAKYKDKRAVWVTAYGRQGQQASNIYFVPGSTFHMRGLNIEILQLWKYRKFITISPKALELIRSPNPTKSIFVETSGLQHQGVYQFARMAIFGKDGALKGWEPYAEDILKLLFILNRNRLSMYKWKSGKEKANNYYVYEFAKYYGGNNLDTYKDLNFGTGAAEYFNVGMLAPMQYIDDLKNGIDSRFGTNALYNRFGPIYRIMSWILAVVKNPDDDSLFDLIYTSPVSDLDYFINRVRDIQV